MEFKYYKMILNVKCDKELFSEEKIEKLVYSKEKYNTKNENKKYIMLLESKDNKLIFILKTIAAPDNRINFNSIKAFINMYIKEIKVGKGISSKLEICKEINHDEAEELIEECDSDNPYFDSTDKRIILDENGDSEDEEEGKAQLLKESNGIKDALNKLEAIQGFEKIKNEAKKIVNYNNILNIKSHHKLNFNYLICCDNNYLSSKAIKLFSEILYYRKLINRRIFVEVNAETFADSFYYFTNDVVKNSVGGVLIINDAEKSNNSDDDRNTLSSLIKTLGQYKDKTMVIFQASDKEKAVKLKEKLEEDLIIRYIDEELYSEHEVYNIIKDKITSKYMISLDDSAKDGFMEVLNRKKNNSKIGILSLGDRIFEKTIFEKFINSNIVSKEALVLRKEDFLNIEGNKEKDKSIDVRKELDSLIGLNGLKEKIYEIIDYLKIQKLRKDKGLLTQPICLHMEFTGNPGTCKTTVARIIGKLFKEIGLLKKGDFYEVGREDLVAKYVGWTAKTVSAKVKEAIGSVLFIDEAYSLCEDRDGGYGDEAISTLIREMENHKDELVVIIAGYPDEMEQLINKNPGFKDRIAFKLDFPDYNSEELMEILKKFCAEENYRLEENCIDYIEERLQFIVEHKDVNFGNGRFIRKLYERAKLAQAKRIMGEEVDDENMLIINKSDIEEAVIDFIDLKEVNKVKRRIGFAV